MTNPLEDAGKRLSAIMAAFAQIADNCSFQNLPITLLLSGSASYGFNRKFQGRLDDVDCIGIVHDKADYFLPHLGWNSPDVPDRTNFTKFANDSSCQYNMIRTSGYIAGTKISIYMLTKTTLSQAANDASHELSLLFPSEHPTLPAINSRLEILGSGYPVSIPPKIVDVRGIPSKSAIRENLFRQIPAGFYAKGALADKLFISQITPNSSGPNADPELTKIWMTYAALSRKQNTSVSADNLVSHLVKSRYFSDPFRRNLLAKAQTALNRDI
jgi:hypothetical protein